MFCLWNMLEQKPDMLRLWHGHSSCPKLNQLLFLKVLNMEWAECLTGLLYYSVITKLLRLIEFWETSSCILSVWTQPSSPSSASLHGDLHYFALQGEAEALGLFSLAWKGFPHTEHKLRTKFIEASHFESLLCTGSCLLAKLTSSPEGCCNQIVGTTSQGFNTSSTFSVAPL